MATSDGNFNWKDQVGKYVWIEGVSKIPLLEIDIPRDKRNVILVLDASDKKVKAIQKNSGELLYNITDKGELKLGFPYIRRYKFSGYLTESQKLDMEVANHIAGISDIDVDKKEIKDCKYMQKSANFELEQYFHIKLLATIFLGIIFAFIATDTKTNILIGFLVLFFLYYVYYQYRKRCNELILKLEARILSEDDKGR